MSIVWTSICTFRETKIKKKDCCGHDFLFKMHSLLCFCNLHFNYRSFNRHSLDWPWWNLAVPSIIIECDRMFLWYGHLWTAGKNDVKIEENGFFRCLHKRKCLLLYRMVLYISHDSLGWDGWKESNLACLPDSSNSDSSKQHKNDSKGQWSELTPRWWIPNWPKRPAFSIWMLLFNIQMLYGTPFTRWHSRALWMSKWDEKKKVYPWVHDSLFGSFLWEHPELKLAFWWGPRAHGMRQQWPKGLCTEDTAWASEVTVGVTGHRWKVRWRSCPGRRRRGVSWGWNGSAWRSEC